MAAEHDRLRGQLTSFLEQCVLVDRPSTSSPFHTHAREYVCMRIDCVCRGVVRQSALAAISLPQRLDRNIKFERTPVHYPQHGTTAARLFCSWTTTTCFLSFPFLFLLKKVRKNREGACTARCTRPETDQDERLGSAAGRSTLSEARAAGRGIQAASFNISRGMQGTCTLTVDCRLSTVALPGLSAEAALSAQTSTHHKHTPQAHTHIHPCTHAPALPLARAMS